MARNKGMFKFAANFEVKAAEALDPRVVVSTKAELINKETWPYDGDTLYLYKGLLVGVADEQSIYMLIDPAQALDGGYAGWKRMDGGAASKIEIVNDLTTGGTDKALSAEQGKVLGTRVSTLEEKITAIFTFKGTKSTIAELPEDGSQKVGDVWHVTQDNGEYVYTGEAWELLGLSVDLSAYATTEAMNAADAATLQSAKEYTDAAKGELTAQLGQKVDKAEGKDLVANEKIALIDQNASDIAALKASIGSEDSGLVKDVADLKVTVGDAESGLVKDVNDLKTQLGEDQVRAIDTTAVSGIALAEGSSAKSVKVTVVNETLAASLAPSLGGTVIKVGKEISQGAAIGAEDTVADALEKLGKAISTAQSGGITSITSTDNTIAVSGEGNARDIKVNVDNLVNADSSLSNQSGKLDLVWIEVE